VRGVPSLLPIPQPPSRGIPALHEETTMATPLLRRDRGVMPMLRDELEQTMQEWLDRPWGLETSAGAWCPRCDLEEAEDAYVLHVELAGVEPDDIDVSVEDHTLTVKGERHFYAETSEEGFTRRERTFGSFYRAVRLPEPVTTDQVEATHRNGVLTVRIPKSPQARAARIEVKSA
jgi:HSP20 family protein